MVVIWVGGHQKHVWNKECTGSHPSYAVVRNKISKAAWVTHLTVLASSETWSGSRCDSSFPQAAEISLWIFPRDLKENIHIRFETRRKNMTNTICLTVNSHISISAEASLPVGPKWILMNLPCGKMYKISMKCYRNQPANSTESMNQWIYTVYYLQGIFIGTHKTGWVVIPQRFGITKRLHGGVRLNDLILQSPLREKSQMSHYFKNV